MGRLTILSNISNQTILKFCTLNLCNNVYEYCIQLQGAHPISRIILVFLSISLNLFCISSSLKALRALYHSCFALLK